MRHNRTELLCVQQLQVESVQMNDSIIIINGLKHSLSFLVRWWHHWYHTMAINLAVDDWNNGENQIVAINLFYLMSCLFLPKKKRSSSFRKIRWHWTINRKFMKSCAFLSGYHLPNWLIVDVIYHIILSPFITTNDRM